MQCDNIYEYKAYFIWVKTENFNFMDFYHILESSKSI